MTKLLLIHTGGTISMAQTPDGLAPQSGLLESAVAQRLPSHVTLVQEVFDPLLDSADVGMEHWNGMLDAIETEPDASVIVTHGTDTMSYTGAALAQALAGQKRRVVLCGSMIPLGMEGDAEANLDLALALALDGTVGTVLAFAGKALPAEGLVKHDSSAPNAFRCVPQKPLKAPKTPRFKAKKLAVLTLTPSTPASFLRAAFEALDGAVLRIYGAGTATSDPAVLAAVKDAISSGKRVRAVSQCEAGGLKPGAYAAGASFWNCGMEDGGQETAEAALIHLWLN